MHRPLAFVLALAASPLAAAVPLEVPHQGRLLDADGAALEGAHDLTFALYNDAASTSPLWTETQSANLVGGYFAVRLGSTVAIDASLLGSGPLFLGISVDGAELPSRLAVGSQLYAITASNVDGGRVNASAVSIAGAEVIDADGKIDFSALKNVPVSGTDMDTLGNLLCTVGDIPEFDGSEWACAPAPEATFDASAIVSGTLNVSQLPVGTGPDEVAAGNHTHIASDITAGEFDAARIPSLDAAKIASGTLDAARIPSLDAAKIASGTFDAARIPSLDAAKIGSGTLDAARIPSLDAAKITTGSFSVARIPDLDAAKIATGTIAAARLPVGTGATQVAAGNHTHAPSQLDALTCPTGQIPKVNAGGAWACAADTVLTEAQVEGFITNGAVNLAAGSQVGGAALATQATIDRLGTAAVCSNYMRQASARTGNTLWANLDADWTGAGVCGSGWHVCNFQEYTVYSVQGACSVDSSWIVGGFSNIDSHRRSIWSGQDSVQCQAGNALATYGKWGPYHGRVHCESMAGSKPVLCCANR